MGENMNLKIKIFSKLAQIPHKAYPDDAGFDLFFCGRKHANTPESIVLPPYENFNHSNSSALVHTGIGIELPQCPIPGHCYQAIIKGRSGLTSRGLMVFDGVIDAGYRGELLVKVMNLTHEPMLIEIGQKIAQLIIYTMPVIEAVELVNELTPSSRGQNGHGSTGNG